MNDTCWKPCKCTTLSKGKMRENKNSVCINYSIFSLIPRGYCIFYSKANSLKLHRNRYLPHRYILIQVYDLVSYRDVLSFLVARFSNIIGGPLFLEPAIIDRELSLPKKNVPKMAICQ